MLLDGLSDFEAGLPVELAVLGESVAASRDPITLGSVNRSLRSFPSLRSRFKPLAPQRA